MILMGAASSVLYGDAEEDADAGDTTRKTGAHGTTGGPQKRIKDMTYDEYNAGFDRADKVGA